MLFFLAMNKHIFEEKIAFQLYIMESFIEDVNLLPNPESREILAKILEIITNGLNNLIEKINTSKTINELEENSKTNNDINKAYIDELKKLSIGTEFKDLFVSSFTIISYLMSKHIEIYRQKLIKI